MIATIRFFVLALSLFTINSFAASPLPAQSTHAMVATTQHLATQVGLNILKKGGNAVDAVVAIGYALAVVEPCCGNLGGGGFMTIHLANGKNTFIDFRETAPLNIRQSDYLSHHKLDAKKIQTGFLAVGVPGTVKGLNYALNHFGTFSLSRVLQPAIDLAQKGFVLNQGDVNLLKKNTEKFLQHNNVAQIFLNHGKPYKVGETLKQPQLANTLRSIMNSHGKAFYHGWIAKAIVKTSNAHGGKLSLPDFANYKVIQRAPITCHYHSYSIITAPPPSSGGITLCQMLNILSVYPLTDFGFHSAQSVHAMVEAMRYAYADRNEFLGDPAFVLIPKNHLLSKKHAASIRQQIKPNQAGDSKTIGLFAKPSREKPQTTSFAVVDKAGNAVSVTYTLNGYFGIHQIAGNTGFFLNNEMDDFTLKPGIPNLFALVQGKANAIAPGKRPLSSMTPTIVMKDGHVFLVTGAAGGSTIITQVLQTLINIIHYGMNPQQAIDMPRFHMQWLPDKIFMEPFAFSLDTQRLLEKMGYRLQLGSPYKTTTWGASVAILKKIGMLYGAMDSRRPAGLALGY